MSVGARYVAAHCGSLEVPRKKKSLRAKTDEERIFRIVLGSLKACILAHGPITLNQLGSAAKRTSTAIQGAISEGHIGTVGREVEATPSAIYWDLTKVESVYDDETGNLVLREVVRG